MLPYIRAVQEQLSLIIMSWNADRVIPAGEAGPFRTPGMIIDTHYTALVTARIRWRPLGAPAGAEVHIGIYIVAGIVNIPGCLHVACFAGIPGIYIPHMIAEHIGVTRGSAL